MPLDITDFTNESESGVFDQIMGAIDTALDGQYDAERITGAEYATVYLGALQVAVPSSIEFLKLDTELAIAESQSAQDLALKQAQQDLAEQQLLTEVSNTAIAAQKALTSVTEGELMEFQRDKTEQEVNLVKQKYISEWAQTKLSAASGTVSGLMGSQSSLYDYQAAGFQHKAAHDALKAFTDILATSMTSGEDAPTASDDGISGAILTMVCALYNNAGSTSPSYSGLSIS